MGAARPVCSYLACCGTSPEPEPAGRSLPSLGCQPVLRKVGSRRTILSGKKSLLEESTGPAGKGRVASRQLSTCVPCSRGVVGTQRLGAEAPVSLQEGPGQPQPQGLFILLVRMLCKTLPLLVGTLGPRLAFAFQGKPSRGPVLGIVGLRLLEKRWHFPCWDFFGLCSGAFPSEAFSGPWIPSVKGAQPSAWAGSVPSAGISSKGPLL